MLIYSKHCEHCNHNFDETLSRCPKCHTPNENRATLNYKNKVAFIPLMHQLLCFLIGLGGLYVFEIIFQLIFLKALNPVDAASQLKFNAAIIFPSYLCVFVALILILLTFFGELAPYFNKARPYIAGILFGIGLIVFSILYNVFIQSVYPTDINVNEQNARNLTTYYPFISIIVLGFLGPICEEITYRLGLFSFCSRFNRWLAYVVTVLVFALIHFDFAAPNLITELVFLPNYLISGLLLTIAYEQEGPAASMTAHIFNNLYSVIGVLIASGINK